MNPRGLLQRMLRRTTHCAVLLLAGIPTLSLASANAQNAPSKAPPPDTPFVVESYYRIQWGHEEEFIALFEKNHLPFLRRQLEKGVLLDVRFDKPREHMAEGNRWDFRMTLVYRDASTAYRTDNITEADYTAIVKNDEAEAVFKREERRRFELLLAHWDINVQRVELLHPK